MLDQIKKNRSMYSIRVEKNRSEFKIRDDQERLKKAFEDLNHFSSKVSRQAKIDQYKTDLCE